MLPKDMLSFLFLAVIGGDVDSWKNWYKMEHIIAARYGWPSRGVGPDMRDNPIIAEQKVVKCWWIDDTKLLGEIKYFASSNKLRSIATYKLRQELQRTQSLKIYCRFFQNYL